MRWRRARRAAPLGLGVLVLLLALALVLGKTPESTPELTPESAPTATPTAALQADRAANAGAPDAVAESKAYADLEQQVRRYPADERAWVLKARLDLEAGRHADAAAAYAKAMALERRVSRDPGVWVEYAEARGLAQGGSLLGEPERYVARALALDARHPSALDLAGSAAWEAGNYALAAQHWQRLLAQMPASARGDARREALVRALQRAEARARFSLPPGG